MKSKAFWPKDHNTFNNENQLLATLGVFILWLGWYGFNGGSQLAWGGANALGASNVVLITNLAAAAGGLVAPEIPRTLTPYHKTVGVEADDSMGDVLSHDGKIPQLAKEQ